MWVELIKQQAARLAEEAAVARAQSDETAARRESYARLNSGGLTARVTQSSATSAAGALPSRLSAMVTREVERGVERKPEKERV